MMIMSILSTTSKFHICIHLPCQHNVPLLFHVLMSSMLRLDLVDVYVLQDHPWEALHALCSSHLTIQSSHMTLLPHDPLIFLRPTLLCYTS
jgi:hypothetical protein